MSEPIGGLRRKYTDFTQKVKSFLSPDGEVLVEVGKDGLVQLDGTPIAPPINYSRQPSMLEIQREQMRLLTEEASRNAAMLGQETLEDADDFDVGDDDEIRGFTSYELDADPEYLAARADLIDQHNNPKRYDIAADEGGEGVKTPSGAQPAKEAKPTPQEPLKKGSATAGEE